MVHIQSETINMVDSRQKVAISNWSNLFDIYGNSRTFTF